MKKFASTLTILSALCVMAYAGPEQYSSGKEMKQVVPVPPPCPTWAGFYIGGFGGYKYGNIDTDLDLGGFWLSDAPPDLRDAFESDASRDLSTSGAEAGGLIGFNYVCHNWLFGVEAAGGYLWLRDSHSDEIFSEGDWVVSSSFKTHYLFTFGPRIGYTFCRWMPYVTGGLAVGDLELDQNLRALGRAGDQPQIFFDHQGGSESQTNAGWFAGAGLEYALTNHWRVRGQYEYVDLGSVHFSSELVGEGPGYTGDHHADLTEHNVSFAIIYGF